MSIDTDHVAQFTKEKMSDPIVKFVVKMLVSMAENYPADGDPIPLLDDIIASTQEQLDNFTYNSNKLIEGLKEAKANARTSTQES